MHQIDTCQYNAAVAITRPLEVSQRKDCTRN